MTSPSPSYKNDTISPAIFYWGAPVVLITTSNKDSTSNIAPMSSAFWLGNRCMLGLGGISQTTINLLRTKQCVLNLPSDDMSDAVDALARTTGLKEILTAKPGEGYKYFKRMNGYEYVPDKFGRAGLTAVQSDVMAADADTKGFFTLEVKVVRTHVHRGIRMEGSKNRIDPDRWRPMIMSFQELYGLRGKVVGESVLARIGEEEYRGFSNEVEVEKRN
ncbi:hypothetical protein VE02_06538 [Pseudogymnoascus sp. 03VT05]|nr:hypothetical protein VE02_06538 [Pseudogymnoascus sp. 03VT05]